MDDRERNRLDALLDLLADEVARRLEERSELEKETAEPAPPETSSVTASTSPETHVPEAQATSPDDMPLEPLHESATDPGLESKVEGMPDSEVEPAVVLVVPSPPEAEPEPIPVTPSPPSFAPFMARLALGVLIAVALINVPLNSQGIALARSIPSSAALVIRDGLVVKEATSPEIWVYRDGVFHWITSLDAFEHHGYRWEDVHVVEPGFLNQFGKGSPLFVLLKCDSSPHIYRLEAGQKRWIVDIPTFEAEGYVWKDVKPVSCSYLRGLPDGESVPPGRGSPPPPLP